VKKNKKPGSVTPIYLAAATWLILALLLPMYRLWALLLCAAASIIVGTFSAKRISAKQAKNAPAEEPAPAEEQDPMEAEIAAIIKEGALAQKEMGRLYGSIQSQSIRQKINQIMQVSDKIVQDAKHDPADVPQIKKFLSYYLPTTIKLLNAYDRMSDQGIEGDNITSTMKHIEDMLDTTIVAYRKQLDALFANQALDIDTDIQVMNAMLAREGLSGDNSSAETKKQTSVPNTGYSSPFGSASPLSHDE
jgi:5-bromo-4-chloroindolyl phosphate hydrolysis protein